MHDVSVWRIAVIVLLVALGVFMFIKMSKIKPVEKEDEHYKEIKGKRGKFRNIGMIALWIASGLFFGMFIEKSEGLHVSINAERVTLFGIDFNSSILISLCASLLVIVAAVLIRIFVIPKFSDQPKGLQNILEILVETLDGYVKEKTGMVNENLTAYFLSLGILLVTSALVELVSLRPPIADLTVTASMALVTFVLINFYGIRKKGVGGRLKQLAQPMAIVAPFKFLSDIAVPISLACRLFGNMLGGMIVMHLLYMALGAFGVGIPAVAGLFFNAFHPGIQIYIFITLSLTFIGEAVEDPEEEHHDAKPHGQKA